MATGNSHSFFRPSNGGPLPPKPSGRGQTLVVMFVIASALVLMLIACLGILVALLMPAVAASRDATRISQTRQQLMQIGVAIQHYHAAYHQFPPAFTIDVNGRPTNSWRVLLTPFLQESKRWQAWDPQRRWDSPVNARLGSPAPQVFTSPMVQSPPTNTETHVFAVRHPSGVIVDGETIMFSDVADGLENTIMAAYLPHHTTHWAAPEDISLERLQDELANVSSVEPVILLFASGAVTKIDEPIPPILVESMVTRDGKETTLH